MRLQANLSNGKFDDTRLLLSFFKKIISLPKMSLIKN